MVTTRSGNVYLIIYKKLTGAFGVGVFGIELLNASSPLEWVNRLELSLEIAEDILSSLIILVDKGGIVLTKGRV